MEQIFIREDSLPKAYHESLKALDNYGAISASDAWKSEQKEIGLTMCVKYPFDEPMISKCFVGGPYEVEHYFEKQILGNFDFDTTGINGDFTLHQRMEEYEGIDQIQKIISILKADPTSRRAIVDFRIQKEDLDSDYPPANTVTQYMIRDNKLICNMSYRSADVIGAFIDMFVFILLQKRIADELGVDVGEFIYSCNSYHCYKEHFELLHYWVEEIIEAENINRKYKVSRKYLDHWEIKMKQARDKIANEISRMKEV